MFPQLGHGRLVSMGALTHNIQSKGHKHIQSKGHKRLIKADPNITMKTRGNDMGAITALRMMVGVLLIGVALVLCISGIVFVIL